MTQLHEVLIFIGTLCLIAIILAACAILKPKGEEWDDDHDW